MTQNSIGTNKSIHKGEWKIDVRVRFVFCEGSQLCCTLFGVFWPSTVVWHRGVQFRE